MTSLANKTLSPAIAAHQAGDMPEAERLYRAFIDENPYHADAWALLGIVIGAQGNVDHAMMCVEKAVALDPHSGLLRFHQGTVLMAAQKLPEAIAAFSSAIELQPETAHLHYNLANALRAAENWQEAIARYREVLRLDPKFLDAYNNLALSLVHENQYDEALDLALQAVALDINYGAGWLTLCNVAEKLKDYDVAVAAGRRVTDLLPHNHYAWFGYGVALNRVNRDEEAIDAYKKALELNQNRADIWDNLAQTYQSLNWLTEAEAAFRKAVEVAGQIIPDEDAREVLESEYGNRHWHLALIELLRGKYKEGFARYRSRVNEIKELKRLIFPFPLWKGENLAGKTLLVCDEQGYGDTLMLARFLPVLHAQGLRIVCSVHPVLLPLFQNWSCIDTLIVHGDKVPPCDTFCSFFDLPHRLGITLENLPNKVPYIPVLPPDEATLLPYIKGGNGDFPPPGGERSKNLDLPLGKSLVFAGRGVDKDHEKSSKPKIGVVWGGSPLHLNDNKRSVPLSIFADLFSTPDVTFYSFNRDLKPGDAELLPHYPIENLAPRLTDFAVAARLIGQMDLVIACDTATAHLAGALGKKVWILLPFAPDWRWLTGRSDSPWYPTARLFRQPKPGDWASVIAEVKATLKNTIFTQFAN